MSMRIFPLFFSVVVAGVWAQDEWGDAPETVPQQTEQVQSEPAQDSAQVATPESSSSAEAVVAASSSSSAPKSREVPVRYWVEGDSVELEAIFVKIEKDTVYLKAPNEAEQKLFEKLQEKANNALQASNGQEVEEEEDEEEVEIKKDTAEIIMTDAVKESMAGESDSARAAREAAEQLAEDAADDFETALEKEDVRLKHAEIAKVEEEIRQREIQDSIEAANANPFIKIYRLNLKRLFNLEDNVMIDLSLSNYVVPVIVKEEKKMDLYPPGKANLLVVSNPAACSLFVNGVPLKQLAPDTIKNIRPGKYTIAVMQVLKDVEWWGSAVVKINADSLNKVEIPVQRPSTRLTLNTDPEAVEVFIDEQPTENIFPHYMTDVVVDNIKPKPSVNLYFRKVGYRDTTITTEIKAYMPNIVNVEMTPVLDDLEFIEQQNAFNKERSQRRIGRGLLWGSIVPFVAGGVMWFLAERNWSDAADKKKAYEKSAFASEDTKKMVRDNHDLNKKGDVKGIVAAGLGALGVGLLTAGIILAF
ncbi:hypothetical protein [Fibrobacter sp. UBA4309]|uniref:hypothetical protein n=1 Tax=Fibrobacter sp. UBA4309 TaxID=1946537 RepID=UPI0025C0F956|nr:hypothetical protein [Fibrobacter sp. UBA4309]